MERIPLPAAEVRIAGRRVSAETLFGYAGAFQLSLSTALPDDGVQLHSSYLGHEAAERSSAAHLLITPGLSPRVWTVDHDTGALPVMHARRHCLLDHLAVLADELRERTHLEVLLDVPPNALEQLDRA